MAVSNITVDVEKSALLFQQATPPERIAILHFLAKKIHQASKTARPGAFFSQKVHAVLGQFRQLPREDRYAALQEILAGEPTRLSEAYASLDTNMRMAFWYQLVNDPKGNGLSPMASGQTIEMLDRSLLADLEHRDSNELVSFLREAVQTEAVA